ncbi:nuclear transport factor 2 family protein [Rhodococcoides fascians A21d2]|uniref:nuclear transport factor 2 family protein n=1 Tax=Rhodococcoides fascians TaxID=1828 RepID=UPI000562C88A|nr:nuclear transport factor 2 family protein [Rhodococcus fascians]QII00324.1 nuclear transport factor 2 family protein [Rhodococcus fascians A21d2]
MTTPLTIRVFDAVDTMDTKRFASYFSQESSIRFGNNPVLVGRDIVESGTAEFLGTLDGIKHEVVREWVLGDDTIVELTVTYTRKDGGEVTIPSLAAWSVDDEGLIDDYRVFFDVTPVFA